MEKLEFSCQQKFLLNPTKSSILTLSWVLVTQKADFRIHIKQIALNLFFLWKLLGNLFFRIFNGKPGTFKNVSPFSTLIIFYFFGQKFYGASFPNFSRGT